MKNISYCKHVLTNEQILANEMRLVQLLEMDQYHILLKSGEIKTDFDKVDCIRDGIEYYCEYEPDGIGIFLKEFEYLSGSAEQTGYELYAVHIDGSSEILDSDQDIEELVNRNFQQIAFGDYKKGTTYRIYEVSGKFKLGTLDLAFWCLNFLLSESPLFGPHLKEKILDTYRMQED